MNKKFFEVDPSLRMNAADVASGLWRALSGDKILFGMGLVTVLALFGAAMDKEYSVSVKPSTIDLHPDDTEKNSSSEVRDEEQFPDGPNSDPEGF